MTQVITVGLLSLLLSEDDIMTISELRIAISLPVLISVVDLKGKSIRCMSLISMTLHCACCMFDSINDFVLWIWIDGGEHMM